MTESRRTQLILSGFALAMVLVAVMGAVTVESLGRLLKMQERQEHSLEVRLSLNRLLSLMADGESAQRGFVITGDESFLEPYQVVERELPREMMLLKMLLASEPEGQARFERLERVIKRKHDRNGVMIAARRKGGFDVAGREVASGVGKRFMEAIRREVAAADYQVAERLSTDRLASDDAGRRAQQIVLGASFLTALSTAFSLDQVRRSFRERAKAKAAVEQANAALESRVEERTKELSKTLSLLGNENNERKRLETEVLRVSEREQRRIADDLHDGHAQLLAGALHLCRGMSQRLAAQKHADAKEAENLRQLIREALEQTRAIARGLHPVKDNPRGLMAGLEELARRTSQMFEVDCTFFCAPPLDMPDSFASTHLYRIAQEAINNALKHGESARIAIALLRENSSIVLQIEDNGRGFPAGQPRDTGLGISIMKHRASLIQGRLDVRSVAGKGVVVTCKVPAEHGKDKEQA